MHPYIHELTVPRILDERRRQAPPRRTADRPIARRAGDGLVAVGATLVAAGRRLQRPAPVAEGGCAAC